MIKATIFPTTRPEGMAYVFVGNWAFPYERLGLHSLGKARRIAREWNAGRFDNARRLASQGIHIENP